MTAYHLVMAIASFTFLPPNSVESIKMHFGKSEKLTKPYCGFFRLPNI